jgi:hypothetical protein
MNKIPLTKEDFPQLSTIWLRNNHKENEFLVTIITPEGFYVTNISNHSPLLEYHELMDGWEWSGDRFHWHPCYKKESPTDTEILDWLEKHSVHVHWTSAERNIPTGIREIVKEQLTKNPQ